MEVQAVNNFVVIHRDEQESKTEGGILIPDSAKKKLRTGVVISVGDYVTEFSAGDRVIFKSFEGQDLEIDKTHSYLFIEEKFVMAKLKETVKTEKAPA